MLKKYILIPFFVYFTTRHMFMPFWAAFKLGWNDQYDKNVEDGIPVAPFRKFKNV